MSNSIGGYFELELKQSGQFHGGAIALNSGRNCLKYLVKSHGIKKVYLPYYICDVVIEALTSVGVAVEYYKINSKLEPEIVIEPSSTSEYILYVNYFGLMTKTVQHLAAIYGSQLIVDNSQAFYCLPIKGVDTFYSPRKFFGVPDGGYLYTKGERIEITDQALSYDRMLHLAKRIDISPEAGFKDYQESEANLDNAPIKKMSKLTVKLLGSIDYKWSKSQRRANFKFLEQYLSKRNKLRISLGPYDVPMVYPLLLEKKIDLSSLLEKRLYTARYWNSVLDKRGIGAMELEMVENTVFLPIDQRYTAYDMKSILRRMSQL